MSAGAADAPPPLTLAAARRTLAAQPFSELVGARLAAFGDGAAVLELDVRDELRQQNGFLHGGVLAYAADNCLTFAAGSVLGPAVMTSGFAIEYMRPADGARLRAHARVVHAGRRKATCRCDLLVVDAAGAEVQCAAAQGTVMALRRPAATWAASVPGEPS